MMKTRLLLMLLTLLLFAGKEGKAQGEFAPVGAEWYYAGDNYDFVTFRPYPLNNLKWVDHLKSIGRTTFHGFPCKELVVERMERSGANPDSLYLASKRSIYIYEHEDTVFAFNERFQSFTPLYVFNAAEGDTICLPAFTLYDDSFFCFIIDSIRVVDYDGEALRTFYTRVPYTYPMTYSYNWGLLVESSDSVDRVHNLGKYVEKLGGFGYSVTGLFPTLTDITPDVHFNMEGPVGLLTCYKDSLVDINLEGKDCDQVALPVSVTVNASKWGTALSIYPNPASYTFKIKGNSPFPTATEVWLTDISGKQVMPLPTPAGKEEMTYDIGHLPGGIYVLQCGNRYYKLIVAK